MKLLILSPTVWYSNPPTVLKVALSPMKGPLFFVPSCLLQSDAAQSSFDRFQKHTTGLSFFQNVVAERDADIG